MGDRRSLTDGLKSTPPPLPAKQEEKFVYGKGVPAPSQLKPSTSTAAVSTRLRSDLVAAVKRASLERQLEGEHPHTMREIMEVALEPWLRDNGYLP